MSQLELIRLQRNDTATMGVLIIEGYPRLVTLELPWNDNKPEKSCIPVGTYLFSRVQSPKFGETFEIENVPNRSHILFHAGNTTDDTKGCILVANRFGVTYGRPRVIESRDGFEWLLRFLNNREEGKITIRECL